MGQRPAPIVTSTIYDLWHSTGSRHKKLATKPQSIAHRKNKKTLKSTISQNIKRINSEKIESESLLVQMVLMEAKIRGLMIQLRRRKLIDEINGSCCAVNLNRRWDRGFKKQGANNIKKMLCIFSS